MEEAIILKHFRVSPPKKELLPWESAPHSVLMAISASGCQLIGQKKKESEPKTFTALQTRFHDHGQPLMARPGQATRNRVEPVRTAADRIEFLAT